MPSPVHKLSAAAVAVILIAVSTGSIAATPAPVPQPTAQQASAAVSTNPWLMLSAMTGNSSSAASAATTAAKGESGSDFPPIAPLVVILGTIALGAWILFYDESGKGREHVVDDFVGGLTPTLFTPVSPA